MTARLQMTNQQNSFQKFWRHSPFFAIRNLLAFAGIFLSVFFICGCNSPLESHTISFEHECWKSTDSLHIRFPNQGLSKKYSLKLDLVFTQDFKYRNLYVGLWSESPSGKTQQINFPLALMDDAGNWFGKPSGKTILHHANLTQGEVFQQDGDYQFKLFQFMQDDLICGVSKAEFSIWEEK